jgi:hypothetical protein
MEVLDYTLMSKGAAVTDNVSKTEDPSSFTYVIADESLNNLHVYCGEGNEAWINCRDNGTVRNADASVIARLLKKKNTHSA